MRNYLESRKAKILELGFKESGWEQLVQYAEHLWASNENLNLVSRKMTESDLVDNHIIDSLLAIKDFPLDGVSRVADFGSGGGLPAVLFAIQFPTLHFVLFEKSPLKQDFLKSCKKMAPNLEVQADIPIRLPNIQMVTARGFKPVDVLLDMSRDYYQNKGRYYLLKARREKIDEEIQLASKKFKDLKPQILPLKSPVLEVERHIVKIGF